MSSQVIRRLEEESGVQTVLTFHNSGHGDPPAPWEEFWGVHSATRWGAGSALWNFLGDVLGETKALVSYFSSQ